jgi:hypothetical protein
MVKVSIDGPARSDAIEPSSYEDQRGYKVYE